MTCVCMYVCVCMYIYIYIHTHAGSVTAYYVTSYYTVLQYIYIYIYIHIERERYMCLRIMLRRSILCYITLQYSILHYIMLYYEYVIVYYCMLYHIKDSFMEVVLIRTTPVSSAMEKSTQGIQRRLLNRFVGWANNRFDNLHIIISLETKSLQTIVSTTYIS